MLCYGLQGDVILFFFFSSRRRHTRFKCDWSSDVCSSDLPVTQTPGRNVCTTSTRSRCASITASMDLYAIGVSSVTSASLRHSTQAEGLQVRAQVAAARIADAEFLDDPRIVHSHHDNGSRDR